MLFNLDHAKEAIRKLDYAILVEGQMDCISVYAAGFHNVIASSGTAFTELQAKLLGRFTKNVVVNFDPDTAGARATERTLGLLVEEEFNIKVLTLEPGFDPDLFIRRKGKDAYGAALKNSQKYFDYLIERARAQFPVAQRRKQGEGGQLSAAAHPASAQPHRARRAGAGDCAEAGHRLRRPAAGTEARRRQPFDQPAVKAPAEAQITGAERILIRALASATADADLRSASFDPRRRGRGIRSRPPGPVCPQKRGSAPGPGRRIADRGLLAARTETVRRDGFAHDRKRPQPAGLDPDERRRRADRRAVEGAVRALRRIQLRRKLEGVQRELQTHAGQEASQIQALLQEKMRLKRALMDPSLAEDGPVARPA